MSRFDANGMLVHPKPIIRTKQLEIAPTSHGIGLSLTIFGKPWLHWSVSLWFDSFWASPTISLHWLDGWVLKSRHIRL